MLLKTHLTFAFLIIILFISSVNSKFVFVGMVVLATILPDLDSGYSTYGRGILTAPLRLFVKHRGIIHSFTFAILASILLAVFIPVASLGFFVGYSVHLITDSFTKEGIQPFWPFRARSSGFITAGGKVEESLFLGLILINVVLLFFMFVVG